MRENTPPPEGTETTVLLAGFDPATAGDLLALEARVLVAPTARQALEMLGSRKIAVLCIGERLRGPTARALLEDVRRRDSGVDTVNVVLDAGPEPELFQSFIDHDELYYLSPRMPPRRDVREILKSAVALHRLPSATDGEAEGDLTNLQSALELARQLARESDAGRALALTREAIEQRVAADGAECLLYDPRNEVLWTRRPDGEERLESAAAGLVSFVVRTGVTIRLERVGQDPRYDPEADNDGGSRDQRFLAVPVGGARRRRGVVVALRHGDRQPFTDVERQNLLLLAEEIAPMLGRFALEARVDRLSERRHTGLTTEAAAVFRREAIEHHSRAPNDHGNLLELSPNWAPQVYRLLLLVVVAAVLFSFFGTVSEYASGAAVVRVDNRTEISSPVAGTLTAVEVEAGDAVGAGQRVARLYGAEEIAELERIHNELDLGLIDRLRNPADRSGEGALSALAARKRLAEARLEARSIRAPHAGIVSDLRVRPGQHLQPGQAILSLTDQAPELSVIALFPGHYRPSIEPGMALRLELDGYRYAYQYLVAETVDEEVVGPGEARRLLGSGIGDAVPLAGPVVFVRARLAAERFEHDGRDYEFHDGMQGVAEIRIRGERILQTLIPGLKALGGGAP